MITSLRNAEVLDVVRLHRGRGRAAAGLTLLEGLVLVGEAVATGYPVRAIYGLDDDSSGASLAGAAGVEFTAVSPEVLAKLSTTEEAQSPVAVIAIPAPSAIPAGRVIVAWGVGDPGNCGSLIRTAAAFSYGFVAGPGSADPWSPKVLRAGAGGNFRTPLGKPNLSTRSDPEVGCSSPPWSRGAQLPDPSRSMSPFWWGVSPTASPPTS